MAKTWQKVVATVVLTFLTMLMLHVLVVAWPFTKALLFFPYNFVVRKGLKGVYMFRKTSFLWKGLGVLANVTSLVVSLVVAKALYENEEPQR